MEVKRTSPCKHLSKGAKVEASSREEGFRGAWFPAIILDPQPSIPSTRKKRKKLNSNSEEKALVQYETLVSDDDPSKPLTELVDVSLIRAKPPDHFAEKALEPGEAVDAFHLDAWWPGVVINVVGDKYTVGFKNPPDLLEKCRSELRLHWELQEGGGIWYRPPKEMMMTGSIFIAGTEVEVNLNKEHLMCAWFPAIYLGQLGINSFLLQYKTSNNYDVKVVVCIHQIRPQPPKLDEKDFSLLDVVDAYHNMGWWVGKITKVLTGKRYMVKFKFTEEEKECRHLELRPHLEWTGEIWKTKINGKWVAHLKEDQFTTDYEIRSKHACERFRNFEVATPLESSGVSKDNTKENTPCSRISRTKQLSPCTDKSPYGKTKKKLPMSQQPNDDATILSLCKKLKRRHSEDSVYARKMPVKRSNRKAPVREREKTEQQQVKELDNQATICFKRTVKKGSEIEKGDAKESEDVHGMDNIESSGIRSESEVTWGSHAGTPCLLPMEVEQQNEDGVSSEIKGKGKLPELLVEYSKDPAKGCKDDIFELPVLTRLELTGEKPDGTGVVAEVESTKSKVVENKGSEDAIRELEAIDSATDYLAKEVQVANAGICAVAESAHDQPLSFSIDEMNSVKTIEGSSNPAETANQQNGVRVRQGETADTGSEDAMREVETVDSAMGYSAEEVQVALPRICTKTSGHDQPFSLCTDEMSVKSIEGSSNPAGTANQQNDVKELQVQTVVAGYVEQEDGPNLPFVKSSPIWKTIESMDVYKNSPQKPHFRPLVKCKEALREGSAIGNMITFASVVEKTSKLQVGEPRDVFDKNLEALVELEDMGFDVSAVHHRLNKLLEMKVELEQLQDQSKGVKIKIMNHTLERTKHNEKISGIDKEIKALQEKRAKLVSEDVTKGFEISRLQSEVNRITEGIQSIQREFERVAAVELIAGTLTAL